MIYENVGTEVTKEDGKFYISLPTIIWQKYEYTNALILSLFAEEIEQFVRSQGKNAGSDKVTISEYKGYPILEIKSHNAKRPIKFGRSKAQTIIDFITDIDEFVNDKESEVLESQGMGG